MFSDNISGSKGGSIGAINSAFVELSNVTVKNGNSDSGGAAYADDSAVLLISESVFFNNTASSRAGGFHCAGMANITLHKSVVNDNQATSGPGGAFVIQDSASLVLLEGEFKVTDSLLVPETPI